MAAKKLLKIIGLIVVVLILVIIIVFHFAGSSIIAGAVQKAATKTLGVPVTVKGIDLSPFSGKVGVRGLVIKNPPGYANDTLLELGEADVQLTDFKSLFSNTIKIKLIKLDGTKLTLEQKGLTSNLKEILDKLPKEEKKEPQPKTQGPGKNLVISKLDITGTNVKVKLLPIPGKSDTVSMNLDPIVMENLGTDSKLDMGTLFAKVLGALAVGVAKQGVGVLPKDMVSGIDSAVGELGSLGKGTVQEGQKALETTTGAGKGAVEGLKGLLGGKKDKKQ